LSGCDNPADAAAPPPAVTSPGRAGPIDIIFLVTRLENLIASGKKLPLTSNVVLDQSAALGLIDELRVAIPEEIRAAKRINSEGERIIEKAQEEAETIVARAQEQAAFLIEERGLTQAAEDEGRRILERTNLEAQGIRQGADEYAASVLTRLEAEIDRTLHSIRKGIAVIDSRTPLEVDDDGPVMPADGYADDQDFEPAPSRSTRG
jgi:hypothetical protein